MWQGAPGAVDVYLSAGFDRHDASCHEGVDGTVDSTNCSIYRLRVDTRRDLARDVERVAGPGAWMPAVSPDGGRLAYGLHSPGRVGVYVKSLTVDDASVPGERVSLADRDARWPTWRGDDTVLFHAPDATAKCLNPRTRCAGVTDWGDVYAVQANGGTPEIVLGHGPTAGGMFDHPVVHPTRSSLVASHGRFVQGSVERHPTCTTKDPRASVSCGLCPIEGTPNPQVADLETGQLWWFQVRGVEPERRLDLAGCAHLDWSPSGKRLLCTEQDTGDLVEDGASNRLFAMYFDTSRGEGEGRIEARPLFTHPPAEEIWDLEKGQSCEQVVHRYAEFCGDDDHVVASVTCACSDKTCVEDPREDDPITLFSRVFLIDLGKPGSPVYTDLTATVERAAGLDSGSLHGVTATCSTRLIDNEGRAGKPPDVGTVVERRDDAPARRGGRGRGGKGARR